MGPSGDRPRRMEIRIGFRRGTTYSHVVMSRSARILRFEHRRASGRFGVDYRLTVSAVCHRRGGRIGRPSPVDRYHRLLSARRSGGRPSPVDGYHRLLSARRWKGYRYRRLQSAVRSPIGNQRRSSASFAERPGECGVVQRTACACASGGPRKYGVFLARQYDVAALMRPRECAHNQ